jgi:kynurenine 3-monooxygenase
MAAGNPAKFTVVGAGLGGALMAVYLGRAGYDVEVYERRADPRITGEDGGRSINLAISTRGLESLAGVGLADEILRMAIPMRGRMMHSLRGELAFQPYGTEASHVINSVSRAELNIALLNAAEKCGNVRLVFGRRCTGVDLDSATVSVTDVATGETAAVGGDVMVGADGAFSAVRQQMQRLDRFDYEQAYLEHGYKELTIPAGPGGRFLLEKHALHIWPRGGFMLIALPNLDGSFTSTLFWPLEGENSAASLLTAADVRRYFATMFPDAVPLMPTLIEDWFRHPASTLVTIRCRPWYYRDKAVLLGDACHAVVPFYGQGANAAFEDCLVLSACLAAHAPDRERAFTRYQALRKRNTDALADLSLANFVEMRDHTASRAFLLVRRLEKGLHRLFPARFIPLYTMVTFSRTPYAEAVERARRQWRVVTLAAGTPLAAGLSLLLWRLLRR